MSLIKAILKFFSHVIQALGNAEGLRHLIDTSLPSSVGSIFDRQMLFSHSVVGAALLLFSSLIHQEPTSLSIFQEIGLVDKYFNLACGPLPVSFEVIYGVANAYSAVCLNENGLQSFKDRKALSSLFKIFIDPDFTRTLIDGDLSGTLGHLLDEFSRHQPSIQDELVDQLIQFVEHISDIPNIDSPITQIEILGPFLEGLFQNASVVRLFTEKGGIERLLTLLKNPLNESLISNSSLNSITRASRMICEVDPAKMLDTCLKATQKSITASQSVAIVAEFLQFQSLQGNRKIQLVNLIDTTKKVDIQPFRELSRYLGMLSDVVRTPIFGQGQSVRFFLKSMLDFPNFLKDLELVYTYFIFHIFKMSLDHPIPFIINLNLNTHATRLKPYLPYDEMIFLLLYWHSPTWEIFKLAYQTSFIA